MTLKKTFLTTLAAGATALASLSAGPLVQTEIAKDAKWLAHIDMERLMESSFSGIGVAQLKEAIEEQNESAISVDIDMVLDEIKSITAYGTTLTDSEIDGVLILKTGDRLQAIFDGLLAHQEMESDEPLPVQRVDGKPYETFVIENELYFAFPNPNVAIASKSFEKIEAAYAVVEGQSKSLKDADDSLVLNQDDGFFLMVTANGINSLKNVPPQARMLQKTKGGQLSIGEDGEDFRANLILTTANREVSLQLYRIVQGMLALASFTQVENQSMMEVVNSVNVKQGENSVELDFRYPVEKLMKLVETLTDEGHSEPANGEQTSVNRSASATGPVLASMPMQIETDIRVALAGRHD